MVCRPMAGGVLGSQPGSHGANTPAPVRNRGQACAFPGTKKTAQYLPSGGLQAGRVRGVSARWLPGVRGVPVRWCGASPRRGASTLDRRATARSCAPWCAAWAKPVCAGNRGEWRRNKGRRHILAFGAAPIEILYTTYFTDDWGVARAPKVHLPPVAHPRGRIRNAITYTMAFGNYGGARNPLQPWPQDVNAARRSGQAA